METLTIETTALTLAQRSPAEHVGLELFNSYLSQQYQTASGYKKALLSEAILLFKRNFSAHIAPSVLADHEKETFAMANQILSYSLVADQHSFYLVCTPVSGQTLNVYHHNSDPEQAADLQASLILQLEALFKDEPAFVEVMCYRTIWMKYLSSAFPFDGSVILPYVIPGTDHLLYFEADLNTSYIQITSAHHEAELLDALQKLDAECIEKELIISELKKMLPLSLFTFSGFQHIMVKDITPAYLIRELSREVDQHKEDPYGADLQRCLKSTLTSFCSSHEIEVSFMPMLKVNGRYTFDDPREWTIKRNENEGGCRENLYDFLASNYRSKPQKIFLEPIPDPLALKYPYLECLRQQGVQIFSILPVFADQELVGAIEMFSYSGDAYDRSVLGRIDALMPVISRYFKYCIDSFNQRMELVIKEKFTALQPSVIWRFNEAAWHYLRDNPPGRENLHLEDITFEQVYPLYGAIDIRNSTVNRNEALKKDMVFQLQELIGLLESCYQVIGMELLRENIFICGEWLAQVKDNIANLKEAELTYFLEVEIRQLLTDLSLGHQEIDLLIQPYLESLDEQAGSATAHRRELEISMNAVIQQVNTMVDALKEKAQRNYPCFFEKFRTDGVEYDLYIGQSITPQQLFKKVYLDNLRLLQLENMVSVAMHINALTEKLPIRVETTQLIFVNPNCIDIRFRPDEKRFDVEGAYNIRYHIVKKRIDKVLVRHTGERLTVPGKIALVYFNQKDINEYLGHIKYLQKKQLLMDDLEYVELEPLQGITGLRAVRVSIR